MQIRVVHRSDFVGFGFGPAKFPSGLSKGGPKTNRMGGRFRWKGYFGLVGSGPRSENTQFTNRKNGGDREREPQSVNPTKPHAVVEQSFTVHTNDKTHYTVIDEQKLNIRKPTYTLHTDGSIEPLSTETWRERDRRFAEVTESRSRSDRLRLRKIGGLRRRERGGG